MCMGGSRQLVNDCPETDCPLYPHRLGDAEAESDLFPVISLFCLYCAGEEESVRLCPGKFLSGYKCSLWPVRFGPLGKMGAFLRR